MKSHVVTRFAPSPTGFLHIGHAYAALCAYNYSKIHGGKFILRIEDIDEDRCREKYVKAIYEDLDWLGLSWEQPVRKQSNHFDEYKVALKKLDSLGLLYPCFCTRRDIRDEIKRAGGAPHGPEGPIYPGTCKSIPIKRRDLKLTAGQPHAFRLDIEKALKLVGNQKWLEFNKGHQTAKPEVFGDIVIARKDIPTSYHLSVTVDDAIQGITLVTRGEDLATATSLHCLLQSLLGLDTPAYLHHPLIMEDNGKKFSKRDNSTTIRALRLSGKSPKDIKKIIEKKTKVHLS
ncbi:MAG: tRNA glutamyl-Q(34) synthetase GluQRS [Rhodospirillaceae bacterium]|nr:tRNA glutamyl-Q(34) synthetase GluQRS [Rhodospirillaceae bacterium]|tara:strand:- start:2334 stop:3197 length:864 start_codon:yes stop_codon:yes gene_type:complete